MKIKCFECPSPPILSFSESEESLLNINYTCRNLHNGKMTLKNYINRLNNMKEKEEEELKYNDCE